MSQIIKKIASRGSKSKIQLALGLTVAAIGWIAPKDSKSVYYCGYGKLGDCDLEVTGDYRCMATNWLADCS